MQQEIEQIRKRWDGTSHLAPFREYPSLERDGLFLDCSSPPGFTRKAQLLGIFLWRLDSIHPHWMSSKNSIRTSRVFPREAAARAANGRERSKPLLQRPLRALRANFRKPRVSHHDSLESERAPLRRLARLLPGLQVPPHLSPRW